MRNLDMESLIKGPEIKLGFENNKFIFSYTKGNVRGTILETVESTPKGFVEFIKKNAKTLPHTFEGVKEMYSEYSKLKEEKKNTEDTEYEIIKNNSGYFISGECPVRNGPNVQSIYALPFDFDTCPPETTLEQVSSFFDGYQHIAYTSFSDGIRGPRFRVILFLKESFLKEEGELQDRIHRTLSKFLLNKKTSWLGEVEMYTRAIPWYFPVNLVDRTYQLIDNTYLKPIDAKGIYEGLKGKIQTTPLPIISTPPIKLGETPPKEEKELEFFSDFYNHHRTFDEVEELGIPLLSTGHERVRDRWQRIGSSDGPGGRIFPDQKSGIELFHTSHGGDEVISKMRNSFIEKHQGELPKSKYGKTRSVFQQIQWGLCEGSYGDTLKLIEEKDPEIYFQFKGDLSTENDFADFTSDFELEVKKIGKYALPYSELYFRDCKPLNELMDAFLKSSKTKPRELSQLIALSIGSILVNLKFTLNLEFGNLFFVIFAETTFGKEEIRRFINQFFESTKMSFRILEGDGFASNEAFVACLRDQSNVLLSLIDEAGKIAKDIGDKKPVHSSSEGMYLKAFTATGTTLTGNVSKGRLDSGEKLEAENIYFSNIKISTKEDAQYLFSPKSRRDGLLNRMVICDFSNHLKERNREMIKMEDAIAQIDWLDPFKYEGEEINKFKKKVTQKKKEIEGIKESLKEKSKVDANLIKAGGAIFFAEHERFNGDAKEEDAKEEEVKEEEVKEGETEETKRNRTKLRRLREIQRNMGKLERLLENKEKSLLLFKKREEIKFYPKTELRAPPEVLEKIDNLIDEEIERYNRLDGSAGIRGRRASLILKLCVIQGGLKEIHRRQYHPDQNDHYQVSMEMLEDAVKIADRLLTEVEKTYEDVHAGELTSSLDVLGYSHKVLEALDYLVKNPDKYSQKAGQKAEAKKLIEDFKAVSYFRLKKRFIKGTKEVKEKNKALLDRSLEHLVEKEILKTEEITKEKVYYRA